MEDLETTLLETILKGKWNLEGDLAPAKIVWTRSFWRAESGGTFTNPRIEVSHSINRREQEIGQLFNYLVRIRIYKWSTGSDDTDITTAKDLKWKMMEEIKRIIDLYDPNTGTETLPTNWKDVLFMSSISIDQENMPKPLLGEEIAVRIKIYWTGS